MTLKLILLIFSLSAFTKSDHSKPLLSTDKIQYRLALEDSSSNKSCKTFQNLSKKQEFKASDIALIRFNQYCAKNPQWSELLKNNTSDYLQPFIINSQFNFLMKKKSFSDAYRLYNSNKTTIKLIKSDFDNLAKKALKANLNSSEKKELRKELYKKSPRFLPKPKKEDYLKVAKDFRRARQFEKALYYYKKIINGKGFTYHQRWYAFKGARTTYKLERWTRMKSYIRSSKQWARFLKSKYKWSKKMTQLHHDANIEYIRTLWTEKGQKQALSILLQLEKDLKGRHSMQMIYWLKGRMAEENKNYKDSEKWLLKASKEQILSSRNEQRVLWNLAWTQRRIGKFEKSQKALENLKKHKETTHFAKTKYLYWQAENLESMGQKSKAKEAFKRLSEFDILGYYGSLAFRKLKVPLPSPPQSEITQKDMMSFFNNDDSDRLQWLVDINEQEVAEKFVKQKIKTQSRWSTNDWANYLNLLQYVGAYKSFFYGYHSLPPKKQIAILKNHAYLLFPRPYKKDVDIAAKQSQVSASLIYSIMKQESGFDRKARSFADAFGLLQLLPQVAKKAAKRLDGVTFKKPEDLYKPNVIIPLGADTIKNLLTTYQNNFILSVASYNASEKAAVGWVKSRYNGDPITFIEDIPYEETKGYIKLVMRNYIAYNRFDSAHEEFLFPEVCLEGLQQFKK